MAHKFLIEKLGGTVALALALSVSPQNVTNWKRRGIPWKYRNRIAMMAMTQRVKLPDDFLEAA